MNLSVECSLKVPGTCVLTWISVRDSDGEWSKGDRDKGQRARETAWTGEWEQKSGGKRRVG